MNKNLDLVCVNTLRALSNKMITKAKSGHPGICLDAAPILHVLYKDFLNFDVKHLDWFNRDRFVLSSGHASALMYSMLHLIGLVKEEDLPTFRKKDSVLAGHPEYGHTKGIEVTTGPLGQGIATAVGMAIASKYLANKFNEEGFPLFDYNVYVMCGDGDLEEGVCYEALSLAGHLKLDNLYILFDSNNIQLDGPVNETFSEDIQKRFEAMGFSYYKVDDANNLELLNKTIKEAKSNSPKILEIKSVIGYGSVYEGSNKIHGKPLSEVELEELLNKLDCHFEGFKADKEVFDLYKDTLLKRSSLKYENSLKMLKDYQKKYPSKALELEKYLNNDYVATLADISSFKDVSMVSTRKAMGLTLNELSKVIPTLIGGSADLASSCQVKGNDGNFSSTNYGGRNILFGVREHAMAAITNGLVLSGLKGFAGGFFVFSDYLRPAVRNAAIMHIPSLFLFSHDSVCVGEDGPTHQPVEHLASFRVMPNLNVVRPADAKEMSYALLDATKNNTYPTLITASRQDLEVLANTNYEGFTKGAYVVYEPKTKPTHIILAAGSEVSLAIKVAENLKDTLSVRVVSMPSMFIFDKQDETYKDSIILKDAKVLALEMAASMSWYKYTKNVFGIDTFGKSMPLNDIFEEYGFTVINISEILRKI